MGKKSNQPVKERRAKVEEMRRAQQAAERRKTMTFIGVSIVLGLGLIAAAALPPILKSLNDPAKKSVTSFGVSAAAASCDAPTTDPASGSQDHIGPGTSSPSETTVKYATIPPSSGKHLAQWAAATRHFYDAKDRPPVEQLVHNLEHGYTVVWYDEKLPSDQVTALKDLAGKLGKDSKTQKFIASAWDSSHGAFPAGKHVGISHWGAKNGHREMCGQVSGEAITSFMQQYPSTDAPEPNGM